MGARRSREEITGILMFNVTFFGTLAWLASAADVAHSKGWWYERGQMALALAGVVMFWMAWWFDQRGRARASLSLAAPAVATLSLWFTAVHSAL